MKLSTNYNKLQNEQFTPPTEKRGYLSKADLVERPEYQVSKDWLVFSAHKTHVRPRRSHEYYHGEPCRLRSRASQKGFEIPPGAVYRYNCTMGHPATSWDAFLFPNPPRRFLMHQPHNTPMLNKYSALPLFSPGMVPIGTKAGYLKKTHLFHSDSVSCGEDVHDKRTTRFPSPSYPSNHFEFQEDDANYDKLERQIWFDPEVRVERSFRLYADSKYCTKGNRIIDVSQLMRPGW